MVAIAVFAVLLAGGLRLARWWLAEEVVPVYVRPLDMDDLTRDVFDGMGADVFGFEYSIPKDHQAVVTLVARDSQGIIQDLSRVWTIAGHSTSGRAVLIRCHPDRLSETKTGRVRWTMKVDGMRDEFSEDDRELVSRSTMMTGVDTPKDLVVGKTYKLWNYESKDAAAKRLLSLEFRFKFEPRKGGYNMSVGNYHEEKPKGEVAPVGPAPPTSP